MATTARRTASVRRLRATSTTAQEIATQLRGLIDQHEAGVMSAAELAAARSALLWTPRPQPTRRARPAKAAQPARTARTARAARSHRKAS